MGKPQSKDHSSVNDDFVTIKSYKGETKNGKRHGQGIYFYPNGDMYDGGWRKSRKYGKGVYIYADGKRLEGYFYHDDYIGKEPNEKIRQRMAKKKAGDQVNDGPKQDGLSDCNMDDDNTETDVRLKSDGSRFRRIQSLKRNKWLRDKYNIDIKDRSTESLDTAKSRQKTEDLEEPQNMKRSLSLGSKARNKHKNKNLYGYDEAVERQNSRRLRENIRNKYNLPRKETGE